jgi:alpha-maltose-1-phosphate synthase
VSRIALPINIDRWKNPIASLLREIAIHNVDHQFYSFSSPQSDEDRVLSEKFWRRPNITRAAIADFLTKSFEVVHHASPTNRNLTAAFLARFRSLSRCVHVFTANLEPLPGYACYGQYVCSIKTADVVVAVSHAVAAGVKTKFSRKVDAVIPNGVDLEFFCQSKAERIPPELFACDRPFVLYVGMLEQRKRPDIFFNIARRVPEIDFVVIGGYYTQAEGNYFLKMAEDLSNVKYLGVQSRARLRDFMASASALIFPSEVEGLALSALEGAGIGLPVLAQPRTSMPEIVSDGVTGWLLDGNRVDDWVEKVREICSWPEETRLAFANGGRAFVASRYSWDLVGRQYGELYRNLTSRSTHA